MGSLILGVTLVQGFCFFVLFFKDGKELSCYLWLVKSEADTELLTESADAF